MSGLVLLLCGVGVGILIGAAFFGGPPANPARDRGQRSTRYQTPPRYVTAPPPPPPVENGGIGNVHVRIEPPVRPHGGRTEPPKR